MTITDVRPAPARRKPAKISDVRPAPARRKSARRGHQSNDDMMGVALLAGPANVVMQLSHPAVGYGVMESRVESGRIDRHPIKRARTTFTYLAVVNKGTDAQKAAYRRAVNKAHAQVRSTEDSPVKYNAFDKNLQLWVAACLYKGGVDVERAFVGELDDENADRLYRKWMGLATTLQVPPEMWPADRAAFELYWNEMLEEIHIDDAVREFLYPIAIARLGNMRLPKPLQQAFESFALLLTSGFLPQEFRDEMHFPWDARRQKQFDTVIALIRTANNALPSFVRQFPFNVILLDLDLRMKLGRPLV
jgi:uncharacterized protein (DUF2236 family)